MFVDLLRKKNVIENFVFPLKQTKNQQLIFQINNKNNNKYERPKCSTGKIQAQKVISKTFNELSYTILLK